MGQVPLLGSVGYMFYRWRHGDISGGFGYGGWALVDGASMGVTGLARKGVQIGGTLIKQTAKKADYLFANRSSAMNWARQQLGHNTDRMYDASGKWIGWNNSKGSVYWGHGDWGKGIGSSTFPHLNYNINGIKGHLFLQDKITNRGMGGDFINFFNR